MGKKQKQKGLSLRLGKLLGKEVEVDQDASVEVGNELGFGVEEIVVGNGDDLRLGEYIYNVCAREPGVLELRHCALGLEVAKPKLHTHKETALSSLNLKANTGTVCDLRKRQNSNAFPRGPCLYNMRNHSFLLH